MNQSVKGLLIVIASALGTGSALATTIVVGGGRIPTALDLWVIALGVIANVATTSLALLTQSPLPRNKWTEDERVAAKTEVKP